MKSCDVTIQMKPLLRFFLVVLSVFQYFTTKNVGFLLNFDVWQFGEQKGLNSLFTCAVLHCLSVQDGFSGEQKKITSQY